MVDGVQPEKLNPLTDRVCGFNTECCVIIQHLQDLLYQPLRKLHSQ